MAGMFHYVPITESYLNLRTGKRVLAQPGEKNCAVLQLYASDVLQFGNSCAALSVDRAREFAPVRGRTSISEVLTTMSERCLALLEVNGAIFMGTKPDNSVDRRVEISPLVSFDGEGLDANYNKQITMPFMLNARAEIGGTGIAIPQSYAEEVKTFYGPERYTSGAASVLFKIESQVLVSRLARAEPQYKDDMTNMFQADMDDVSDMPPTPQEAIDMRDRVAFIVEHGMTPEEFAEKEEREREEAEIQKKKDKLSEKQKRMDKKRKKK